MSPAARLNRRSFLSRITSGAGVATGAFAAIRGARASAFPRVIDGDVYDVGPNHRIPNSDADPEDLGGRPGQVRAHTDGDRFDRPGHGRGPHDNDRSDRVGFPRNSPTGYTGFTDRDTSDTAYHGRSSGPGVSDHDGTDRAGHGVGSQQPAQAPLSDQDPTDAPGRGRGTRPASSNTDHDRNDPAGHGRVGPVTDRDPTDRPGAGRGPSTTGPITNSTSLGRQANPGVTDNDPTDTAGHGRGTGGGGPR